MGVAPGAGGAVRAAKWRGEDGAPATAPFCDVRVVRRERAGSSAPSPYLNKKEKNPATFFLSWGPVLLPPRCVAQFAARASSSAIGTKEEPPCDADRYTRTRQPGRWGPGLARSLGGFPFIHSKAITILFLLSLYFATVPVATICTCCMHVDSCYAISAPSAPVATLGLSKGFLSHPTWFPFRVSCLFPYNTL